MKMGVLCNRDVIVAEPSESVRDLAKLMRDSHVGCVVVVRGAPHERVPVGIVTDRDVVLEVVAKGLDPSETPIALVMSAEPYCAREDQDVYDVLQQMSVRGMRRVPVVNEQRILQGIFAFDDLVEWTTERMLDLSRLVKRELSQERALSPR